MSDARPEPRDDEPAAIEAPARRPLPVIPTLQFLAVDADGVACDLDDPDCIAPVAMTGDEDDA